MKIALVGRVGLNQLLYDGQTVKTRSLYELLKEIGEVYMVDTYNYKKKILITLSKTIKALSTCDVIVLSTSINGRRFFFPLFYYLNKIFKKEIYHSLIGGRLANNIKTHPSWKKYVQSFKDNWVESHELVETLKEMGIYNVSYFANFKKISKAKLLDKYSFAVPFKFCTFSRVQKEKGIEDAIKAIQSVNSKYHKEVANLDIYGPIDSAYEDTFLNIIEGNSSVRYKGAVTASESVNTIKDYYMLLFPTRYYNEGIPGTIIDALAAGVPIIAKKWHYCSEMITNMENGLVYDFEDTSALEKSIIYAIEHVDEIIAMKENCLEKADEYLFDHALEVIKSQVYSTEELH